MTRLNTEFRRRCESISSAQRARMQLRAFDPLRANDLAFCLRAILRCPDEMEASQEAIEHLSQAEGWFGVILLFEPAMILYNPNQSPARYESTIMHELAHIILCHPPGRLYLAPDGTYQRDFNSLVEAEAAYLGSCLQIPRRGFLWAVQHGMDDKEIAHHFGASLEMVNWRRNAILG